MKTIIVILVVLSTMIYIGQDKHTIECDVKYANSDTIQTIVSDKIAIDKNKRRGTV